MSYVVDDRADFALDVGLGTWFRRGRQSSTCALGCGARRSCSPSSSGTSSRLEIHQRSNAWSRQAYRTNQRESLGKQRAKLIFTRRNHNYDWQNRHR